MNPEQWAGGYARKLAPHSPSVAHDQSNLKTDRSFSKTVGQQKMKRNISLLLCGVLSAIVLNTCLQIEVWNHLAGGDVLPNREGGKLRYSIGESERGWRAYQSMRTQDESLRAGRPLTAEEHALFQKHSKDAERRNKVVSWSRGMGTFQYLLAPLAITWSVALAFRGPTRRMRLIAILFSLTNTMALASMLYRGYFND